MSKINDYRRVRGLLLNPDAVALVTTSDDRYLTDRYVIVRVCGDTAIPGIPAIFSELPDGVYTLRATRPPKSNLSYEPVSELIADTVHRLASIRDWRPVKATNWASLDRDGVRPVHILARDDLDGPHAIAVNAGLWHRWHAGLADPKLMRELRAYQPEGKPGHPLRMDLISRHAGSSTVGYVKPVRIQDDTQRYAAEYLAQRTAI
jgi:hypothetical protein